MGSVVLVLLVVLMIGFLISFVQRRRRSLVAERGTSIGADLGALSDQPRVRVTDLTTAGPESARLVLSPEQATAEDQVFVISLREEDSGYQLLREWQRSGSSLALVIPPGSRLLRLRSLDSLQPLTLRRLDAG